MGGLFVALVVGSTVPSALWPTYQDRLGFGVETTTVLFACYVLALLPATLVAGPVADTAGARPVVAISVVVAGVAILLLAAAPSVGWLAVGRVLQGVAVGTAGAPLTAALLAVEAHGNRRQASLLATALLTAAAGGGAVLSGVVADRSSLVAPYVVAGGLLVVAAAVALPLLPGRPPRRVPVRLWSRPALPSASGARRRFIVAAVGSLAVWAIGYAGLAVAPSFSVAVLHRHDPLVVGVPAGVLLLVSAAVQVLTARRDTAAVTRCGLVVLLPGLTGLAAVAVWPSLPLLLAALGLLGAGHGLVFMAALREATAVAAPGTDAATSSLFFAATYLGGVLPVLGIGALSALVGLAAALQIFCAVAASAVVTLIVVARRPHSRGHRRDEQDRRGSKPLGPRLPVRSSVGPDARRWL